MFFCLTHSADALKKLYYKHLVKIFLAGPQHNKAVLNMGKRNAVIK